MIIVVIIIGCSRNHKTIIKRWFSDKYSLSSLPRATIVINWCGHAQWSWLVKTV